MAEDVTLSIMLRQINTLKRRTSNNRMGLRMATMVIITTTLSHRPAGNLLHLEQAALLVVPRHLFLPLMDPMVEDKHKHRLVIRNLRLTTDHNLDMGQPPEDMIDVTEVTPIGVIPIEGVMEDNGERIWETLSHGYCLLRDSHHQLTARQLASVLFRAYPV